MKDRDRKTLKKIFEAFEVDDSLLEKIPPGPRNDKRITAENLEVWAGDHLFDDYPILFGIKERQGQEIRAYFQEGLINRNYNFVPELYREFPEKLEGEEEGYLEEINEHREEKGLETFSIDDEGRVYLDWDI